jgi:AraC-like DNA-binding protein
MRHLFIYLFSTTAYRMLFHTHQPSPSLSAYVRFFWILEGTKPSGGPFIHRATAECCQELIFYYTGEVKAYRSESIAEKTFSSGLYAQSHAARKFQIDNGFGMLGVYLYPHTLPLLFNIPADQISNHNIDISTLFGKEGAMLEEKVMCAATHLKRIELISAFLEKKLSEPTRRSAYLSACIRQSIVRGIVSSVSDIASACNISVRQLERDFKTLSGFSPRLFSKLIRFRYLLENVPDKLRYMTDLAYAHDYYDQAHFTNEFKRFTGLTPTQYFMDRADVSDERMTAETVRLS